MWAKSVLVQILKQRRIQLSGQIQETQHLPQSYTKISQKHSQPLDDLLTRMLRDSDNLIAENILKTLGRLYFKQASAGFSQGVRASQEILKSRAGIDLASASLNDGSGLSQHNLLSARHIMQVLAVLQKMPEFHLKQRLAVGFESGSLRYRRSLSKYPLKAAAKAAVLSMYRFSRSDRNPHGLRLSFC